MRYKSKNFCKGCGSNDSFEVNSYSAGNNGYKAVCCNQFLCWIKYDDDDHKKMKEEVSGVLRNKAFYGKPLTINKEKLLKLYPDIYPFILLNEVYRIAKTININFEFE